MPTTTVRHAFSRRLATVAALVAAAGVPAGVYAQQVPAGDSALAFNQIFFVGAIGDRDPGRFVGSVGCGEGGGGNLSNLLNESRQDDVVDRDLSNAGSRNGSRDLWRFCDNMTTNTGGWTAINISAGDSGVNEERLQNSGMAPDELFAQIDQAAAITRAQVGNVGARVRGLRLAALGRTDETRYAGTDGTNIAVGADGSLSMNTGLNAGDAMNPVQQLGFFANTRFINVDSKGSSVETGSETDGFGLTAGVDYAFSANFIGGFGLGYTDLDSTFDNFGAGAAASLETGDSAVTNFAYQAFFSYFPNDSLYFDGVLGASQLSFDFTKVVPAFDAGQAGADAFAPLTSSPDGDTLFMNLGVGYDVRRDGYTLTPYARIEYLKTEVDGFTETSSGDDTLSLTVAAQENTSLTSSLGATIAFPMSRASGVYMPYLRGEYVHEFDDQADQLSGFLTALPSASFTLLPAKTDEDYGYLGAGITGTFANNWSGFADFDALVGFDDLDNWQLTIGFRKQL